MPMLFTTAPVLDTQCHYIEGTVDTLGHWSLSAPSLPFRTEAHMATTADALS